MTRRQRPTEKPADQRGPYKVCKQDADHGTAKVRRQEPCARPCWHALQLGPVAIWKADALRLKPHDPILFGNAQKRPTWTDFGIVSRITERGGILVWPIAQRRLLD